MLNTELLHYPEEIMNIITGLANLYDKDCLNIILYGSTALNKLSYKQINDKYRFYSDIEFIVVPKEKKNENDKAFRKELMNKSFDYLKGLNRFESIPFVDVNSVSESFFRDAQLRISNFEIKNNSIVLKGNNLLALMPDINKDNYNFKIQNIEIVKALKILTLESNKWFLYKNDFSEKDKENFCYFLSSCFLNVLRTLLPYKGAFKLTTKERVHTVSEAPISNCVKEYFSKVWKDKCNLCFSLSPEELFSLSFIGYKNLLCLMLDVDDKDLLSALKRKPDIFYEDIDVELLVLLTCFFISSLENIYCSINDIKPCIKKTEQYFDELLSYVDLKRTSYSLKDMINEYGILEKDYWKIIGSKD